MAISLPKNGRLKWVYNWLIAQKKLIDAGHGDSTYSLLKAISDTDGQLPSKNMGAEGYRLLAKMAERAIKSTMGDDAFNLVANEINSIVQDPKTNAYKWNSQTFVPSAPVMPQFVPLNAGQAPYQQPYNTLSTQRQSQQRQLCPAAPVCNTRHAAGQVCWVMHPESAPPRLQADFRVKNSRWKSSFNNRG